MPSNKDFEVIIVKNEFPELGRMLPERFNRGMDAMAEDGLNHAKLLMNDSPASGRTYKRPGGKTHTASSPGNAPRPDTGALINSLRWERRGRSEMDRVLIASAEHGYYLEYGTEKMAARPFFRPTANHLRADVRRFFVDVVKP